MDAKIHFLMDKELSPSEVIFTKFNAILTS